MAACTHAHKTYTTAFEIVDMDTWDGHSPDHIAIEVSRADVENWLFLAGFAKQQNLASMERFDFRCEFLFDAGDDADAPFRADMQRLVIDDTDAFFAGEQKHNPSGLWQSGRLSLKQLASDFGFAADHL
ncbi:hypothetical protein [Vreelandella massiliensis]|uniref:hypothetical protein n=1 Tax=Vreelandella massiliensis TaxID=1816686 RepID=UPI00096A24B3|nr:hypothetical protein [Halomonas massiliensis]